MDERRVARVMAIVALGLASVCLIGFGASLVRGGAVGERGAESSAAAGAGVSERGLPVGGGESARVAEQEVPRVGPRGAGWMREARRRWLLPLALVLAVLTLGPIKRAFGFDRATPLALFAYPALVVAGHLALERRPAIESELGLGVQVAALGAVSALVAFGLARVVTRRGDSIRSTRRVAASVGWSAFVSALFVSCWWGLAVDGGWPPEVPLSLFALGAAGPALVTMALMLFVSGRRRGRLGSGGVSS